MTYRLRNIVLAVVLAMLAAVLTSFYVSNYKKSVQKSEENVTVFVATRDIEAGTPGARAAALLKPIEVERRTVVPGAITAKSQVANLIAVDAIYAEEQVTARRFRPIEEAGIRAELKGNLRALQISGDDHQLLAGTLKRGDRVDVLANFKFRLQGQGEEVTATRVVLRDIQVLRPPAGSVASGKLGGAVNSLGSVQLAVTDAQAQKLHFARQNGELHLALRGVIDSTDSSGSLETLDTVLCDGLPKNTSGTLCFGRGIR